MTDLRVMACGSSGIYGIAVRTCAGCDETGEHIAQWQGPYFGRDHHCLSCGVTDREGDLTPLTEANEAYWVAVAEHYVLPTELFERYVAADERMASERFNRTVVAERYSASLLAGILAEVHAHHAAVAEAKGVSEVAAT